MEKDFYEMIEKLEYAKGSEVKLYIELFKYSICDFLNVTLDKLDSMIVLDIKNKLILKHNFLTCNIEINKDNIHLYYEFMSDEDLK